MKLEIMGSMWTVTERTEADDDRLTDCDGYCDWTTKEIVIEREAEGNLGNMEKYIAKVKRHEIVHAFLLECGLHESSGSTKAWAANEEMVDWFARIGPRIYQAWKIAGAI